jgi:chlorite dismutase
MAQMHLQRESPPIDLAERAGHHVGQPQELHTRLFVQLQVFSCDRNAGPSSAIATLRSLLAARGVSGVIYDDLHDPRDIGVLCWSEDPGDIVRHTRAALQHRALGDLRGRPGFSMLGRTYATGFETDLRFALLERPRQTLLNPDWPWAVWYPLRRTGAFAQLADAERGRLLAEHGALGRAYGAQDLAHDIRLACCGLDTHDNEFVIGLVGKELHPLSHVVESMRRTQQTAEFMQHMGPFFSCALRSGTHPEHL